MLPRALPAQDTLQRLREDVQGGGPSLANESAPSSEHNQDKSEDKKAPGQDTWDDGLDLPASVLLFPAAVATSPFWVPHVALDDDFALPRSFAQYPYQYEEGYYVVGQPAPPPDASLGLLERGLQRILPHRSVQNWAGRLEADWGGDLDSLDRISGHLLLSTASRFGLDAQADSFREATGGSQHDRLWLGDGNLVYRFAQGTQMEFRAGLGLNWLAGPETEHWGVNTTYGFDWFPRRPWVISSELDWGTLGSAELFRFRGTVGVTVHGIEVFTGYEYLDIDRLHQNSLLAGLRLWF